MCSAPKKPSLIDRGGLSSSDDVGAVVCGGRIRGALGETFPLSVGAPAGEVDEC